eukprot:gene9983-7864_t
MTRSRSEMDAEVAEPMEDVATEQPAAEDEECVEVAHEEKHSRPTPLSENVTKANALGPKAGSALAGPGPSSVKPSLASTGSAGHKPAMGGEKRKAAGSQNSANPFARRPTKAPKGGRA